LIINLLCVVGGNLLGEKSVRKNLCFI